jgi:hypothetical protein
MTDEEQFYAWLDGELGADDAAAVAERVAADPALTQHAEQHRALGATLRDAFDPIASSPVPDHLLAAVRTGSAVVDLDAAGAGGVSRRTRFGLPQWAAIAATLVLGIVTGTMLQMNKEPPIVASDGPKFAATELDEALDVQLASAEQTGAVRIGMTFRDKRGAICRSFTDARTSGLACQDRGQWRIRGQFAAPEGQEADYRMAAGMDPALAALVDLTMAGDPLDADQERAAREGGWR